MPGVGVLGGVAVSLLISRSLSCFLIMNSTLSRSGGEGMHVVVVPGGGDRVALAERGGEVGLLGDRHRELVYSGGSEAQMHHRPLVFDQPHLPGEAVGAGRSGAWGQDADAVCADGELPLDPAYRAGQ